MKKILFYLAGAMMMLLTTNAHAQLISLGESSLSAGGGFSIFSLKGNDSELMEDLGFKDMPGFFFGGYLDYAFSTVEGLTVEPGAFIYHYGRSYVFGTGDEKREKSYHANYLSVPVNIKYALPLSDQPFALSVFTGPRFNLGLGGNMFSTGKTYPGLRRIEAQWGIGLAATVQEAVILRVSYDTGLTHSIKDSKDLGIDSPKVHRNALNIGVTFAF